MAAGTHIRDMQLSVSGVSTPLDSLPEFMKQAMEFDKQNTLTL